VQLCIPVIEDRGLESRVSGHFGSAPGFMIVDTDSGQRELVTNTNAHHAHGMCQPLAALAGHAVDAVVVGGIGGGALMRLRSAGIVVYRASRPTVGELVAALAAGTLEEVGLEGACASHHGHHHSHPDAGH
jgi:predicted Fe-Mo cluster-binding NifX family protein